MEPELINHCSVGERDLFFLSVGKLEDFPESVSIPSQKFAVFLALDATGLHHTVISKIVRQLLHIGAVYFCCYGPDCERVHDIIDEEIVQASLAKDNEWSGIMTTWHNDEPLIDALCFFVFNSHETDRYSGLCKAGVAISCGNSDWDQEICRDLKTFVETKTIIDESGAITGFEPR